MDKLKVGIVGVSGYGGGELARLLLQHPQVELTYVTSGTYAGQPLSAALPGTAGRTGLVCEKFDPAVAADKCDFLFLAGENGLAMRVAPLLLEAGKKVVDLSADFRLKDPAFTRNSTRPNTPRRICSTMPCTDCRNCTSRQIKQARLLANPGCYVTSAILALAARPGRRSTLDRSHHHGQHERRVRRGPVQVRPGLPLLEVNESARPYGVGGTHRHTPEIEQALSWEAKQPVTLSFTPHLIPITRGILTTAYANVGSRLDRRLRSEGRPARALRGLLPKTRRSSTFWNPASSRRPSTSSARTTATSVSAVDKRTNRVIVTSVIDNLVKGAAGQAIQNMNLMCGFDGDRRPDDGGGVAVGGPHPGSSARQPLPLQRRETGQAIDSARAS